MKKFLLSLGLACMTAVGMQAESFDITFGASEWPGISSYSKENTSSVELGGATWTTYAMNNNNNGWEYVRVGAKSKTEDAWIKSNAPISGTVESVSFSVSKFMAGTVNSVNLLLAEEADFTGATSYELDGSFTAAGTYTIAVAGATPDCYCKLVFNYTGGSGNGVFEMDKITFEVVEGGTVSNVAAPVIEYLYTDYDVKLQMTAEEGAEIYYTDNGETPTIESTKYTRPISYSTDATFKAIAVKDGEVSKVTTFAATYYDVMDNFGGLYGVIDYMDETSKFNVIVKSSQLVVAYHDTQYTYVYDGTNYMLLYGNVEALEPGAKLSQIEGVFNLYKGLPEINVTKVVVAEGTGRVPAASETAIEDVQFNIINRYIKLVDVKVEADGSNFKAVDAEGNSVVLYNRFKLDIKAPLTGVTVFGFVAIYNETIQIYPIKIGEDEVVTKPSPNLRWVNENGETVTAFLYVIGKSDWTTIPVWECDDPDAEVEFEISNEDVAYIDQWDMVDVYEVPGVATITAKVAETEEYAAATASFVITVMTEEEFEAKAAEATIPATDKMDFGEVNPQTWKSGEYEFTVEASKDGNNMPKGYSDELRMYGKSDNKLTVTCPNGYVFVKVALNVNNGYSEATIDGEAMTEVATEGNHTTYEYNVPGIPAKKNTIVIGIADLAKQCRIKDFTFTIKPGNTTGIENVEVEATDAAPVYYNLQGVRVANPENGLYIVRRGNKATKEIVK
ncbi:MAG: chitobiase/beta-hexosaminidase C-terminal domain-containing protein [Muribaculaceae bacterium]|nr:chitobiase/beta-hexosaminidase C-terminal domain-containing protein [Muribaculaceae bacterium]